jgi:DNA-binding transcriptional MerR regulator
VRIAELSRLSGVTPATIKYYLREGLLPPGAHTHPNQVEYDEHHVTRLRLIRALIDIGGLSIGTTSELLGVLDSADIEAWESVGKAQYAVTSRRANAITEVDSAAERIVDTLLAQRGWRIRPDSPARRILIDLCATLHRLGHDDMVGALDAYAAATEQIVAVDIGLLKDQPDIAAITEKAIVGTILGDTLLSALRQLVQEHASRPQLTKRSTTNKSSSGPARKSANADTVDNRPGSTRG